MFGLLLTLSTLFIISAAEINDGFAEWGAYDDIYADAQHYCCKQYTSSKACRQSANYRCTWLNAKKSAVDKAIIRRFGNKCVSTRFATCKRTDIAQKCFNGCQDPLGCSGTPTCDLGDVAAEDLCLWDADDAEEEEEDEMMFNHAMNMIMNGQSGAVDIDYKLFGSIGLVLLVIAAVVYYKKRANNEKSVENVENVALINGYGTTPKV